MRENKRTMRAILDIAKDDPRIRAAFQTGSKVNPLEERDDVQDFDLIFCLSDLEGFSQDLSFLEVFEPIFVYNPQLNKMGDKNIERFDISVLTSWGSKVDMTFIPIEDIQNLIESTTLISLLMDKDNLISSLKVSSDISLRTMRPTKNEFERLVYEFFYQVLETLPYIYRRDYIGARLAYRKIDDALLKLMAWDASYRKDFKINLGKNYRHLKKYASQDILDLYHEAIAFTDIDSMWRSLFAALSLFRKLGLGLAEKLNYTYPKKMDVEITGHIRKIMTDAKRNYDRNM